MFKSCGSNDFHKKYCSTVISKPGLEDEESFVQNPGHESSCGLDLAKTKSKSCEAFRGEPVYAHVCKVCVSARAHECVD